MTQPPGPPFLPGEQGYPQPGYPQQPQGYPTPADPYSVPVQPISGQPPYQPGYPPPDQGYQPPDQGYPQQPGYPQSPGYPPTQPGYPPADQGYPQPGYPAGNTPGFQQPGYPNYPTSAQPYPTSGAPDPFGYPQQFGPPVAPPRKKRGGLIAAIIVVALLVLCGGGGTAAYLLASGGEGGKGQASATDAAAHFLTAVFTYQDPSSAAKYVCKAARDEAKLTSKINEIKQADDKYDSPTYAWTDPKTDSHSGNTTVLTTTVTLTTADEQVATQDLKITTIQDNGWWVCDVALAG